MNASARVFAGEFNRSDLVSRETAAGTPPVLITRSGACCSRIFVAGALIEKGARPGGEFYARVADPTGAFEFRIDRSRRDLAEILSHLDPPVFVTVLSNVVVDQGPVPGKPHLLVDEIRAVDRSTRDSWIVRTAATTCDRLDALRFALDGEEVSREITMAAGHYGINRTEIAGLAEMVLKALETVSGAVEAGTSGGEPWVIVLSIIREKAGKNGMPLQEIISSAVPYGLSAEAVEQAVRVLLQEDECYQPSRDVIKIL